MSAEFVVPDPPWLVCKGDESRVFHICPCAEGGFELRILDGNEALVAHRSFKKRAAAIRWGFEQRKALQFEGWKHPYDAEIDDAFEEGVGNWNRRVLHARVKQFPAWELMLQFPDANRALEAYAGAPYLGLLTDEELFSRFRVLASSGWQVDADGRVEPVPWDEWQDRWVHAATEILLRDLSLDDERARPDFSFLETAAFRSAVAAYACRTLDWGDTVLVKYGSARFLRPALERGIFRISPARFYRDPSLNLAQQDDELERTLLDSATDMTSIIRLDVETFSPEERSLYTRPVRSAVNYYIFCMAGGWEPRLFDDFEADACLVITDPGRFALALRDASRAQLPGWHFDCAAVRYIDPVRDLNFLGRSTEIRFAPFFCKDFRYMYQKEVRATWLPPDPKSPPDNLDHLFVELGDLRDYCELVEIGEFP